MERFRWMVARWKRAFDQHKVPYHLPITPYQWQLFLINQTHHSQREHQYDVSQL